MKKIILGVLFVLLGANTASAGYIFTAIYGNKVITEPLEFLPRGACTPEHCPPTNTTKVQKPQVIFQGGPYLIEAECDSAASIVEANGFQVIVQSPFTGKKCFESGN
jgi:hypothetical protein